MRSARRLPRRSFLYSKFLKLKVVFLVVNLNVAGPDWSFSFYKAANLFRISCILWLPFAIYSSFLMIVNQTVEFDVVVTTNLAEPISFLQPIIWIDELETKHLATLENYGHTFAILVNSTCHHFTVIQEFS